MKIFVLSLNNIIRERERETERDRERQRETERDSKKVVINNICFFLKKPFTWQDDVIVS